MSAAALDGLDGPAPARWPPLIWLLLRHEWRLTIREFLGKSSGRGPSARPKKTLGRARLAFNIVAAVLFVHAIGGITLFLPKQWHDTAPMRLGALAAIVLLFTLMLSSAMSRVVAAFHERRDLDLLLAAPIPAILILCVRSITVLCAVTAVFAIFIYPIANVAVATGHWWMARLYPLVPVMACATTGIALFATGAIVRVIGIRRARVGLQILSALIGASAYLVSQGQRWLPDDVRHRWSGWLVRLSADDAAWPVAFVVRIAAGDFVAWLALVIGSAASFGLALMFASRRFDQIAQTPEADAPVVRVAHSAIERRITRGFGRPLFVALLFKEWRLILRSPQLISQILLQLLYLMPLLFFSIGHEKGGPAWSDAALAAGVVGIAGTLASALAWLTVAAEDAPDLLAGSPRSRGGILLAKLTAATLPPIAIVALVAMRTVERSPGVASAVLVFSVLSCASAAILAAAIPVAGKRSDFQRRN